MAVAPTELNQNFKEEVLGFEVEIDTELQSVHVVNGKSVEIKAPTSMNSYHFAALQERYIKAGWRSMEFDDDERNIILLY